MKKAGIKVWVLTGDKVETAKTIGFSCALLSEKMKLFEFVSKDRNQVESMLEEAYNLLLSEENAKTKHIELRGIVISGDVLIHILGTEEKNKVLSKKVEGLIIQLNFIANKCEAVLCCRVSPKQKQQIVKMVKDFFPDLRVLAIGDGANDVNMISEAHVGIGVKGVEGSQAARASDFSINNFKALRRLIFVYGRECYRKNSVQVLFNFYKNAMQVIPQLFYAIIYGNASGVLMFTDLMYQMINPVFTSVQIGFYATFDRDCDYKLLEHSHQYYFPGLRRLYYNDPTFWRWLGNGFLQGVIIIVWW